MLSQPSFVPLNLFGVKLCLDATQQAAGAIASWTDLSGNGNNATQATGAKQPVCTTNQQNSLKTVLFTGSSSQTLVLPSPLYRIPGGPNTTISVAKRNTEGATALITNFGNGAGSALNAQFFNGTPGQICYKNDASNFVTKSGNTNTNYNIIISTFNGSTGVNTQVNNGTIATSTNGSVQSTIDRAHIGSITDGSFYLTGGIGELIILDRMISAYEIAVLFSYLSQKWAIAIS